MSNYEIHTLTQDGKKASPIVQAFAEKHNLTDYNDMKDFLFPKLVRKSLAEGHDDLVKTEYLDFYITYCVTVSAKVGEMLGFPVTTKIVEDWNASENNLFVDSIKAAQTRFPAKIVPIEDVLKLDADGSTSFFVCSNVYNIYGASAVLYDEVLADFANKIGEYFYVLPSSVHEMILVPDSLHCPVDDLKAMVPEVNVDVVAGQNPNNILSNNIYRFDRDGLWLVR